MYLHRHYNRTHNQPAQKTKTADAYQRSQKLTLLFEIKTRAVALLYSTQVLNYIICHYSSSSNSRICSSSSSSSCHIFSVSILCSSCIHRLFCAFNKTHFSSGSSSGSSIALLLQFISLSIDFAVLFLNSLLSLRSYHHRFVRSIKHPLAAAVFAAAFGAVAGPLPM